VCPEELPQEIFMKKFQVRMFTLLALLSGAMLTSTAQAQITSLYIAHAASGHMITPNTNPALPVDVSLNGTCVSKGVAYGDITGPYSGAPGTYNIVVAAANATAPCTGASLFTASVPLAGSTTYLGVLSLDSSKKITGAIYTVNLQMVAAGFARFEVANATTASLSATLVDSSNRSNSLLVPAATFVVSTAPAGIYQNSVSNATTHVVLSGPRNVELAQRNVYLYVLAGSPADNSVQVLGPKIINGVF
jgi:hypothetical protein